MIIMLKKLALNILLFNVVISQSFSVVEGDANGEALIQGAPISLLADLQNFQINTSKMLSGGLPNQQQFEALKTLGVTRVIDLIHGDRTEEEKLMLTLDLPYHHISVDWENPTVENFEQYVTLMDQFYKREGITLTHCKLNWRGAVFTYLYRTTQLLEPDEIAKKDLVAIWTPNEVWQTYIDNIKLKYE